MYARCIFQQVGRFALATTPLCQRAALQPAMSALHPHPASISPQYLISSLLLGLDILANPLSSTTYPHDQGEHYRLLELWTHPHCFPASFCCSPS